MSEPADTLRSVKPSAMPTEADLADWNALSREEQLRLVREHLAHPDCATPSAADIEDVLNRARAVAGRRRG